jgi:hypothetical protein
MILNNRIRSLKIEWLIALAFSLGTFSYPITAVLILALSLPTSISNIILKLLYSIIYLYIIYYSVKRIKIRINLFALPLLLFFLVYSIRLIVDVSFRDIVFASGSKFYVYSYYFGATVLPCIMLILSNSFLDPKKIYDSLFYTAILSNLLLFWYIFSSGTSSYLEMLAGRSEIISDSDIGTDGVFINPIQISLSGALLAIISIVKLFFNKNLTIFTIILLIVFFVLGIYNLFIGASRGPLIGFIIGVLFMFSIKLYASPRNLQFFRNFLSIMLFITLGIFFIKQLQNTIDIFLLERIEIFIDNIFTSTKEDRNYLYDEAILLFLDSPIFGNQYVTKDGGYPHNLLVEVPMSTGLIGTIIFIVLLMAVIIRILIMYLSKVNFTEMVGIYSVAIIVLFLGLTSGSIFVNPEIWICTTLILILPVKFQSHNI